MTRRKRIESYTDCLTHMDLAIKHSGIRIPFESLREAVTYRHRLYRARIAVVEQTQSLRYNDLYVQLLQDGKAALPGVPVDRDAPAELVIRIRETRPLAVMTDLDGTALIDPDDPLTQAAGGLRKSLGLDR